MWICLFACQVCGSKGSLDFLDVFRCSSACVRMNLGVFVGATLGAHVFGKLVDQVWNSS